MNHKNHKPYKTKFDYKEVTEEVAKSQALGRCTDRLGQILVDLHKNMVTKYKAFRHNPDWLKDEMVSHSIMRIISSLHLIQTSWNVFGYIQHAAMNNMREWARKEKNYETKHHDFQQDYLVRSGWLDYQRNTYQHFGNDPDLYDEWEQAKKLYSDEI